MNIDRIKKAADAVKWHRRSDLLDDLLKAIDEELGPYQKGSPMTHHIMSIAYEAIKKYYGNERAKRSGLLKMNHINEGLAILQPLGASSAAMAAFCIHPMLQDDREIAANWPEIVLKLDDSAQGMAAFGLAMEYRNVANRGLRQEWEKGGRGPLYLGPMKMVQLMLIADKVQNRKDFEAHYKEEGPERESLNAYFKAWMSALGVSEIDYQRLVGVAKEAGTLG